MSRNGTLLAIPAGTQLALEMDDLQAAWTNSFLLSGAPYPRSVWLAAAEDLLATFYPAASTADRALTARTIAPFALAQPGVR